MLVVTNQLNWLFPSRTREKWRKLSMWRDEGNFGMGHAFCQGAARWNFEIFSWWQSTPKRPSGRVNGFWLLFLLPEDCLLFYLPLRKISFLMTLAQCINGSISKRLIRGFFTSTEKYQEMEIYKIIWFCCLYFICSGATQNISSKWLVYVAM